MAIKLNEEALKKYINETISEEMDEIFGLSRAEKNAKWGYQWDDSLSGKQNRRLRDLNRANIRAAGYNNAEEYEAGTGYRYGEEPAEDEPETQQDTQQEIPSDYPYKTDRQKTGQFQTWFNQNMGGRLVVDGIWGPKTEAAYQQWLNSN
jgi:hypothetical protein